MSASEELTVEVSNLFGYNAVSFGVEVSYTADFTTVFGAPSSPLPGNEALLLPKVVGYSIL